MKPSLNGTEPNLSQHLILKSPKYLHKRNSVQINMKPMLKHISTKILQVKSILTTRMNIF